MQMRGIPPSQYTLIMQNRQRGNYDVRHWLGGSRTKALFLNLNHKDPILRKLFTDRSFRQALSIGINREEINRTVFRGVGQARQISPAPGSKFEDPELASAFTEYDPERANAMLDALHLPRGSDGMRVRSDGKPLRLIIDTTDKESVLVNLIVEYWTALGIATVQKEQSTQLLYARKAGLEHDVIAGSGGGELNPLLDPRYYVPIGGESNQAIAWGLWHSSNGQQGQEPPTTITKLQNTLTEMESLVDIDAQAAHFASILTTNREELYSIGLVAGETPIVVVSNAFVNVPDIASPSWDCRSPGNCAPESFALVPLSLSNQRRSPAGMWLLAIVGGIAAWWCTHRLARVHRRNKRASENMHG